MISSSLVAHGFDPKQVHDVMFEYVNMRLSEDESMERYGVKQTAKAQSRFSAAVDFMEALNQEIHGEAKSKGKLRTGLN